MLAWKLGAVTGIFLKTAANFLSKRVPEMCMRESIKERRKVCISLACVAGVTILEAKG